MSCARCGKKDAPGTCRGCGTVKYCGPECQKADWQTHKTKCGCNGCGAKATPLSACGCGGRLCAPCLSRSSCAAKPAGRSDACPVCFDPLCPRRSVAHLCGHDVCGDCYKRLVDSGTNPGCSVCRRRSMAFGAVAETPSPRSARLLGELQARLIAVLDSTDLVLLTAVWSYLADIASGSQGPEIDVPIDDEIEIINTMMTALAADQALAAQLKGAVAHEDVRAHGKHVAFNPHPFIDLGVKLLGAPEAAWAAYTRRFHMPAAHLAATGI